MAPHDPPIPPHHPDVSSPPGPPADPPSRGPGAAGSAEMMAALYDELRTLAAARLRNTPPGNTLQATALVHEAFMRLTRGDGAPKWDNPGHFFAAAAKVMRDILVDQARRKAAIKHGGGRRRLTDLPELPESDGAGTLDEQDLLDLDRAIATLEQRDPRKAQIVVLRYFGGLSQQQIAELLSVSERTVEREWRFARAVLSAEIEAARRAADQPPTQPPSSPLPPAPPPASPPGEPR